MARCITAPPVVAVTPVVPGSMSERSTTALGEWPACDDILHPSQVTSAQQTVAGVQGVVCAVDPVFETKTGVPILNFYLRDGGPESSNVLAVRSRACRVLAVFTM